MGVLAQLTAWEAGNLWRISWASILITLFSFTLSLITQMFVGHLSELEPAGASIGNIDIQGLPYGGMIGMSPEPRRYTAMGIVCQRALVLQLTTAVSISSLYWYAGLFLQLIGQEVDVAVVGQLYARGLLPQLLAFALFCPMQRFLQAQNIVNTVAYITLVVLIFHTLSSWLAVPSCKETWIRLSLLAFRGLWGYAKLAFASTVMLERVTCINYWNWDFQIMLGLSYAASICVGNELGAGHPKVASVFVTLLVIILSTLYTSSTTVIEAVISLMPLLAFSIFLNGIQPILSGAAIGSGWQAIVAYVNVGAYYLIGLPIGCILGYKTSLGAAGLWWRLIIGVTVQTIALIILTARTNWDNEVEKAMQQLQQTGAVPVNDIIAGPKESTWLTLFWC
ncbi:hypothetical protein GQ55_3G473300 [Panicum hallii var. hallii]|uniref:Protein DETOXIFICATION n=1 Tax=Panicum hallii var. hallii TaxID=1504633 RepID=A0A2T7EJC4_9POAL|nr:hypothetical protein GQ55_3G473300 [Panicum hallii var. hallii]